MILTDKAREDFLKWVNLTEDMFLCANSEREITSLTVDWFDSTGIIIEIGVKFVSDIFIFYVNQGTNDEEYSTRQEATNKAIELANKIYNEKHK